MRCAKCGTEGIAGKKFCAECGSPLVNCCAKCGSDNPPNARFCADCGTPLGKEASAKGVKPSAASSPAAISFGAEREASETVEGERKTVTAVFADIKGSTELMEGLDPEEARAIIDPALKLMIDAVQRYDGYVVQSTGDGIFALFGAPLAHEDHPQRALYAALRMQEEMRRYASRLREAGDLPIEARVGVNTGEVVVRTIATGSAKTEYTPIGHTANLASRLQTLAPIGSIAASEYTSKLCEGYFELRALGPMAVRGISEAINVYEVTGLGTLRTHFELSARRGLTKFVGRERELEHMVHALDLAIGGHGQLVAVMAEAGTGKSRLVYEFKAKLPASSRLLEAYSVSHGKASAWLPVLELLRKYFGLADADDGATRRDKVRCTLDALDPALTDTLPYLFGLLGIVEAVDPLAQMDPRIKRQRTLDAIKRIVVRESLKQPLILIFEDLHWIDEQTQGLLDLLADSIANARVLLLVNYRPEYRHEWTNKSHYVQLGLNPLGRESAQELLAALLGDTAELNPLKRLVIERTGGNPFFIEEMVQALFDEGALVRNGLVKAARSLLQLRLPPTVQGILAARIDRLPSDQKDLLQMMAVIGRESPLGLIRQMTAVAEVQLERMLAELRRTEFIYERLALVGTEYIFKHALTQEVAYNSLLIERRKQLHERAGLALESVFAGQLDDHLSQLAHHYSHSDNFERAIEYLGRAGQQALQRSAYVDAIAGLNAAINLIGRTPISSERIQRELTLQIALSRAFTATQGYASSEVERTLTRGRDLCAQLGDPPEFFPVLWGLWAMHYLRGELRRAFELGEQLLARAEKSHDPTILMFAHSALGDTSWSMGEFLRAKSHLDTAFSLYDRESHRHLAHTFGDQGVNALCYTALNLWALGYPDQALKSANEAIALAQDLSHPHAQAFAEFFAGRLSHYRRDSHLTQKIAEHLIELSAQHGFSFWLAQATIERGGAMAEQGYHEEGIGQIRDGIASLSATGPRPQYLCLLAAAFKDAGRINEGLTALAEALATADEQANHCEAEIHRLRGELLLKQDDSNVVEAENCFHIAIEIARKQSAKSWELRATVSLARLLRDTGRRDEARAMLADIYGWFTEGFDTADLKEAKTLLDELSA